MTEHDSTAMSSRPPVTQSAATTLSCRAVASYQERDFPAMPACGEERVGRPSQVIWTTTAMTR